jgi:hypothetical protein
MATPDVTTWPRWLTPSPSFGLEELRNAIGEAARTAWTTLRATHEGETPYAFGLYPTEDDLAILSACSTEEGIVRRAASYEEVGFGGSLDERARMIRWWDADWPYCCDLPAPFEHVNGLLGTLRRATTDYLEESLAGLAGNSIAEAMRPGGAWWRRQQHDVAPLIVAIRRSYEDALGALDREGAFADENRDAFVLGIFGLDEAGAAASIERLNPPAPLARWRQEVAEAEALRVSLWPRTG